MNIRKDTKNLQTILDKNRAHKNGNNAIKEFHKMHEYIIKLEAKVENLALCAVSNQRELLPKSLSNKAYKAANKMTYEGFVDWWDLHS